VIKNKYIISFSALLHQSQRGSTLTSPGTIRVEDDLWLSPGKVYLNVGVRSWYSVSPADIHLCRIKEWCRIFLLRYNPKLLKIGGL
jgi:hypothetical protein